MNLYLVRHAEAKEKFEDPQRPLSEIGLKNIGKVASFCKEVKGLTAVKVIMHSGRMRARQTAEILAEHIDTVSGVLEANNLNPEDDIEVWVDRLALMQHNIILVGHLPHLQLLASQLLSGNQDRSGISFSPATAAYLTKDEQGKWSLKWVVTPETAGA